MKHSWPKKLNMGGTVWAVEEHKHMGEWGSADQNTMKINIHKTGGREWDVHTLFEEMLHVGEAVAGLDFGEGEPGHKCLKSVAHWMALVLVENNLVKL